jgi:hypothetical protein
MAPAEQGGWYDTTEELPPRPRRRVLTPIPLALLGVLLIACGFIGGVLVEKGQTGTQATSASSGLSARFAALRGGGPTAGTTSGGASSNASGGGFGGRFAGSGAGRATIGLVAYLNGSTLYVENPEGNTVKVTVSAGVTVTKTVTSSFNAIHPGATVVVQGTTDSNGTVTASSIGVGGAGGLGRGLGALFGGSGGVGRTAGGVATGSGGSSEGPVLFGK